MPSKQFSVICNTNETVRNMSNWVNMKGEKASDIGKGINTLREYFDLHVIFLEYEWTFE